MIWSCGMGILARPILSLKNTLFVSGSAALHPTYRNYYANYNLYLNLANPYEGCHNVGVKCCKGISK
jgi:hypothetical protein